MKNTFSNLFGSIILWFIFVSVIHTAQAQTPPCKFLFKGKLAGKQITFCFYPDNNDGNVAGHYYYGTGNAGTLGFNGTAVLNKNINAYTQRLTEYNVRGEVTGYFVGTLKNGIMQGIWTSTDGTRVYSYKLVMQR